MYIWKHSYDGFKDNEQNYPFTQDNTNPFVLVPFWKKQHSVLSTPADIVAAWIAIISIFVVST